jgi:transcriptional regulatory protein GAL4
VDIEKVLSPESPVPGFSTWNVTKESESSVAKETETPSPSSPEALPDISTGFEWAENQDPTTHILDGMAALSVNPRGAGYLGKKIIFMNVPYKANISSGSSANVELLRSLHRNGWAMESSATNRIAVSQIEKPSLHQAWTWNLLAQPAHHRHLVNSLIDSYFYHFNTAYPIIHEATFRAQYNEVIPKPDIEVWNMLFNVMIAIGGWCMDYDMTGVDELLHSNPQGLAQNMTIFSHGCLTLVQALLLMANYTQRQNNPNTGYCYLGVAMKMAISLGMHKEFPDWEISPLDREMRRRVWWCLFAFESGSSMTYGRPILWPGAGTMDTKESLNILDEVQRPPCESVCKANDSPVTDTGDDYTA